MCLTDDDLVAMTTIPPLHLDNAGIGDPCANEVSLESRDNSTETSTGLAEAGKCLNQRPDGASHETRFL